MSANEKETATSDDDNTSLNKSDTIMDRRKANESKRKDTHVSKALANLKADREKKKQIGMIARPEFHTFYWLCNLCFRLT